LVAARSIEVTLGEPMFEREYIYMDINIYYGEMKI
jgi:hypothetical protein